VHQAHRLVNDLVLDPTSHSMLRPAGAPASFKRRLDRIAERLDTPQEANADGPVEDKGGIRPAWANAREPVKRPVADHGAVSQWPNLEREASAEAAPPPRLVPWPVDDAGGRARRQLVKAVCGEMGERDVKASGEGDARAPVWPKPNPSARKGD
jgi:hypothetical protein